MSTPTDPAQRSAPPTHFDDQRVSLHSEEFSADPHSAYREMRSRYGSLVPAELAPGIPATLVVGYRAALRILNDPEHFPSDPRIWQQSVPKDCPVLPVLQYRPSPPRTAGAEHARYRSATTLALDAVNVNALHGFVERTAISLVNSFCAAGSADLVSQYATPLSFEIINKLLGCPPEISAKAAAATASVFDGVDAEEANRRFDEAVLELVHFKQNHPGDDITTRLMQHPARFDENEMVQQVLSIYGVGMGPLPSLVINALRLIMTDNRFADGLLGGALLTRDALDQVLFEDPPLPNASITYPRHPILIDGVWLPAHQPVVISLAGCNNDPDIGGGYHTGNRAHLAWGVGPHSCPARHIAYPIAQAAIDQLLDALPEIRLAVPVDALTWRPGPLHRTLVDLPVTFPACSPMYLP
ncbi:cytochrome P450 [Nocardia miyunensis]|uniref:cytochrome P450 n=1 Tax=Nocardia miyunensis TaxID=282684 RepID=UPI00082E4E8B|nr:cytochrome P450 [Nocardia miyunensis]